MAGNNKHKQHNSDTELDPATVTDSRPLMVTGSAGRRINAVAGNRSPWNLNMRRVNSLLESFGWKKHIYLSRTIEFPTVSPSSRSLFPPNVIRNQKYSVFSFLPMILLEQFKFFFNMYFLTVAMSQLIPALQIGYLFTYFAPLAFVLMVTISKEASDDYHRYRRDEEANSQRYEKLTHTGRVWIPSSKIQVGDLIYVQKDRRVPADMVLLRTTEKNGASFIRTDQLDGETDWKLRLAIHYTQSLQDDAQIFDVSGEIYADAPHKDIYNFIGNFHKHRSSSVVGEQSSEPLSVENTLWTNTVVASGTVLGVVIYTGTETRAVMNTSTPSSKVGLLDLQLNHLSKILFAVLLTLSFTLIALTNFSGLWYVYMMRFLIIFSSIIPLSLRVNLDMGKTVYALNISRDKKIPDTIVRTSNIPEELGRIEYLLTDKTGTLTKNDMELKKIHLGTMSYGIESLEEITNHLESHLISSPVSPDSISPLGRPGRLSLPTAAPKLGRQRDISYRLVELVQALAVCHNVTPVVEETNDSRNNEYGPIKRGNILYQASSPDEIAIVKWTEAVGMILVKRTLTHVTLKFLNNNEDRFRLLDFEILHVFPFTSETKRMGIVIRDCQSNEITFYMKGADVVMSKIVQYNDWLDEECGNMAREGLRTLVIGRKKLSEEMYKSFDERYRQAKLSVIDRNSSVQSVISNMLEKDLELLGLTGVEDKLQDEVKTTLETLRNAGIKIWMLTGDKIETATNIAMSSKLVARNQTIYQIQKLESVISAEDELDILRDQHADCCLVIDGTSLQLYLDFFPNEFMTVAVRLPAVVCCRCSPTQKAGVTNIIKSFTQKRVCCIGDGGNDVSMIQAADVGVGIVGKEGKQASLAADFSVTKFSHLSRLLLWHGRNSYKRSAKLGQFVIHRGLIISIMQAVFSSIFYFAPIALYQGMLMVGYTTIYTMAPVFSLVLDVDVSDDVAMFYPELYKDLPKGRALSLRTFFTWLLISLYQGSIIMILAIWLFQEEFLHIVSISFTALVFNELLMVALEITTWHPYMIYAEIVTMLVYMLSIFVLKTEFDLNFILTWAFVWKTVVITLASCFPLFIIRKIRHKWAPPTYLKLDSRR